MPPYINVIKCVCTKAIAGRRREGWIGRVDIAYSIASLPPPSKSARPISLPSWHSGEQNGGFPLQTECRLSRWIVFYQITSLSWLPISLCEKWLGRQEVQLTAFGSHLGHKYLSLASPLTSLILAPSVSQWPIVGTECSCTCVRWEACASKRRCAPFYFHLDISLLGRHDYSLPSVFQRRGRQRQNNQCVCRVT